eukprot:7079862-Prymnesium_polylepis.2
MESVRVHGARRTKPRPFRPVRSFQMPHWDPGWLVQIEDDVDGHRFAFVFGSMPDRPANVLTQVVAQNTAFYLAESNALKPFQAPLEL